MKQVLIVDDETAITDGLTALFDLEQIAASGAYDREQAERLIDTSYYPVIIADLRLQTEEEGLQLIEDIRRKSPSSRIASLTAFATPEVEEDLLNRGVSVVLRKPMEFDEIVRIVEEMLAAIEAEAEAQQARTQQPLDLEALYRDVHKVLHAIPQRRYGLTPEETDELVQEAWCLFLEKQTGVHNAKPWLAGTVSNLCKQHIQRKTRMRPVADETLEAFAPMWHRESEMTRVDELALEQGLGRIDSRDRQLCTLIGIEGRSYEEVGDVLDMPIGSVGPLFIRAKSKLRKVMETQH